MVLQGRRVTPADIDLIHRLLAENRNWHRTRLSQELCGLWNWRDLTGRMKDMACRSLLLKLEALGHVLLPERRSSPHNALRYRSLPRVAHWSTPIRCDLKTLLPIHVEVVGNRGTADLFATLLSQYHYLGYRGIVGENMKYLVKDRDGNPLACLLFGSAAWKTKGRDGFIGWDAERRRRNLCFVTNNMRFLILPWVQVPHLASHLLGRIAKRIASDWLKKYGHILYLLETFVEVPRFRGVCYRAANWRFVGQTTGRSRNDRNHTIQTSIKDVYVYPLANDFREALLG